MIVFLSLWWFSTSLPTYIFIFWTILVRISCFFHITVLHDRRKLRVSALWFCLRFLHYWFGFPRFIFFEWPYSSICSFTQKSVFSFLMVFRFITSGPFWFSTTAACFTFRFRDTLFNALDFSLGFHLIVCGKWGWGCTKTIVWI